MMETEPKKRYEPPEVEIAEVEVERGFVTSGNTPTWGSEPGYWE